MANENGNGNGNGNKNAGLIAKTFRQYSKYQIATFEPNTISVYVGKKHPKQPSICINNDGNRFEFMINGLTPERLEMSLFMMNKIQSLTIHGVGCEHEIILSNKMNMVQITETGDCETPDSSESNIGGV